MRTRSFTLLLLFISLLLVVQPAFAAEAEGVFLPGWFAWLMVILAVGLPLLLLVYLREKGRL